MTGALREKVKAAASEDIAAELDKCAEYIKANCHPQCAIMMERAAARIRELEAGRVEQ